MNTKGIILLNILFLGFSLAGYSQKTYPLSESLSKAIFTNAFERYGITYELPEQFTNLMLYEHFYVRQDNPKRSSFLYGPILQSTNKNCIVMYPTSPYPIHFTESDIESMKAAFYFNQTLQGGNSANKEFAPPSYVNMNRRRIQGELSASLQIPPQKKDSLDFDEYVTIVTGKMTREMFNADSIFFYDIPLDVPYKDVYNHCLGMIVAKKDRASIFFKLFFTDEGKKKQNEYVGLLDKAIWYDDKE